MNEQDYIDRINRLETALICSGKPSSDRKCECCETAYVPMHFDSVRCAPCSLSCMKSANNWVKGAFCPSHKTPIEGNHV